MKDIRILSLIEPNVKNNPDGPALIDVDNQVVTYAQLYEVVLMISEYLSSRGITINQRVAAIMNNGIEMALTFLAVSNTSSFVPLSPDYSEEQYRYYFKILKIDILLIPENFTGSLQQTAEELNIPVYFLCRQDKNSVISYRLIGGQTQSHSTVSLAKDEDIAIIQFTSGTTATPKVVPRSHKNLYYSTQQRIKEMGLTSSDKVMITAPSHRGISLTDTLPVLTVGGTVIYTDIFDLAMFFTQARRTSPAWILGSPILFYSIADYAERNHIKYESDTLRIIRTAGAPLTRELAGRLNNIFGVPVYEGYGSTECGNIACSLNAPKGYKAGSVGVPVDIEISIIDELGVIVGSGITGEIIVRGPQVITRYENDDSRDSFYKDWFRTGDNGYLDKDGYLFVAGRFKEIINCGGEKISPYEVEAAISGHPDVLQTIVFPIPAGQRNEEAGAAVVLRKGVELYLKDLRKFLYGKVAAFKMPSSLYILKQIPTSESGKVQRNTLYEHIIALGIKAQSFADELEEIILPHKESEFKLYKIYLGILPVKEISITDSFFELGGDSLKAAALYDQIKTELGVQVPLKYIFNNGSIEKLAQYIDGQRGHQPIHPFIMPFNDTGSKTPIFFIHSADGEAVMYRYVAINFDPERPFYGINFNPAAVEWIHPINFEQMAEQYIKDMVTIQPQGPYILAGQCVGGIIAFEMVHQLVNAGQEIALLAIFDSILPDAEEKATLTNKLLRNINEIKIDGLIKYFNIKWYYYKKLVYKKSPDSFKKKIFTQMDKRSIISLARTNYKMKKYDGELVFFKPENNTSNAAVFSISLWMQLVQKVREVSLPGDHTSIYFAENAATTIKALEDVLADIT